MSSRIAAWAGLGLAALVIAAPARGQVCEGLPFRGTAAAAATYVSGDAADGPYSVRQYGGAFVRQLPGWSPLGTHQVVRLNAAAGQARWQSAPRVLPVTRFEGRQASAGIGYTVDALSNSAVGSYVVCASVALEGQYLACGRRERGRRDPAAVAVLRAAARLGGARPRAARRFRRIRASDLGP